MLICVRHCVHRVIVIAALGLTCAPTTCLAQESNIGSVGEASDSSPSSISHAPEAVPTARLAALLPMYASFAGLQALDAHSTMRALQNGGVEANPLLRDLAGRPAAIVALKAGVTASTILVAEKLRRKNRLAAWAFMASLNSFYAVVVVHNYRAIP